MTVLEVIFLLNSNLLEEFFLSKVLEDFEWFM